MNNQKISTYEKLSKIPVKTMLAWSNDRLDFTKMTVIIEIENLKSELQRANLTLRWINGIIRIKSMDEVKGEQNG